MPVYVTLLRGINVGGNKRVKMERLRQSFEELGFEQVQTFIQSGNVVYKTRSFSSTTLSAKIENKLLLDFGFPVPVVSRTREEMMKTVGNNPFAGAPGVDAERLHVMFLAESPAPAAMEKLNALSWGDDQWRNLGREIYLYLPNGVAESKLMKSPLDRILSVVNTTRNWKTVNSIQKMCQECR